MGIEFKEAATVKEFLRILLSSLPPPLHLLRLLVVLLPQLLLPPLPRPKSLKRKEMMIWVSVSSTKSYLEEMLAVLCSTCLLSSRMLVALINPKYIAAFLIKKKKKKKKKKVLSLIPLL